LYGIKCINKDPELFDLKLEQQKNRSQLVSQFPYTNFTAKIKDKYNN